MLNLLKSNYCYCSTTFNHNFRRYITTLQLKEYYAILNVNRSSSQKEIKDSFLKLSKVYHPDNKVTGSHTKFVKLKEAYDAIKEGPPAVTNNSYTNTSSYSRSSTTGTSTSSSSSRYNDPDLNQRAHEFYKKRYNSYKNAESGFGGPFANSSTPWEDFKKDQAFRRQQKYGGHNPYGSRPLIHVTIFLSAIAWIIIYSGVLLIWDYNEQIRKGMFKFKPRTHEEYLAYEEYLRRKESEQLLRTRRVLGNKQTVPSTSTTTAVADDLKKDISEKKDTSIINQIVNVSLDENHESEFEPLASPR